MNDAGKPAPRLLLVDDKPDNLFVLKELIDEFIPGCDLVESFSAPRGLAIALHTPLDGALIDLRMPGMDGIEMCRRFREDPRTANIPILLITAHDSTAEVRTRALEAGARDFISKPIDARELTAKIQVILRDKEAEDTLRRRQLKLEEMVDVRSHALMESEEKFQQLAENINEVFWLFDLESEQLLYVSPAYETVWDRTPAELYRHPPSRFQAIHPEDRPRIEAALGGRQTTTLHLEYRIVRRDGTLRWIRDRAYPVRDGSGRVHRIAGVATDITEQKLAEEKNRHLEHHLARERKLEAIGILAGGIAHDFNNMLASIIGFTEMALRSVEGQPLIKNHLEVVLDAGLRAAELVRQILMFSRESGPVPMAPVAVTPIIKEALKLLTPHLPPGVALTVDLDRTAGPVLCQPVQIQQIIMNLFTNAVHAMKGRNGTLAIRLVNDPEGKTVDLMVEDEGQGMDEDTASRMFDPFFTTRTLGEGTGLGLSIVHGIVQHLGGSIMARSIPEEGSLFHVRLPLATTIGTPDSTFERTISNTPSRQGGHVLVIDDDLDVVYLCKSQLTSMGYTVTGTTSSQDGWRRFLERKDAFDLLLTNQGMPELTGIQLARRFQQIRPGFPVILMSGRGDADLLEEMAEAGIRRRLSKPFLQSALIATIQEVLQ
ncbi:MAG: response regulator [Magnetococcales bacterium]|nr:response regulator [Magnetococcales bacterium]MBF0149432.1 response regulator [Magnetococcales bacterium]MBF0171916.1 response regulator [Magnetococcales bacterium]